jgi:thioredoxin-like negative regulator of GroEL
MKELKSEEDVTKALASKSPVAIFFYMTTCPHCQVMHEPWEALAKEAGDVEFVKAESAVVPSALGISGFPHFVMVRDGKEQKSADGEMSKDELKTKLLSRGGRRRRRGVVRTQRRRSGRFTRRVVKVAHRTARVDVPLR